MLKRVVLFSLLTVLVSIGAFAQTANGTATVTILSGLSISQTRALTFGSILGGTAGTIALSNVAAPTPTYGGSLTGSHVFGTPTSAQFTVSGDGGRTFTVTGLTAGTSINLTRSGGGTIGVSLTAPSCTSGCTLSGTSGSAGSYSLYVGGTLTLAGTELAGLYENTAAYALTVAY